MKIKLKDGTEIEGTPQEVQTTIQYLQTGQKNTEQTKAPEEPQTTQEKPQTTDTQTQTYDTKNQAIIENYSKMNKTDLAKATGMSISSLYERAKQLGVSGTRNAPRHYQGRVYNKPEYKPITPQIIEQIKNRYGKEPTYDLIRELGISAGTMWRITEKLGITKKRQSKPTQTVNGKYGPRKKKWILNNQQIQYLRENWGKTSPAIIGKTLGIPYTSLYHIAKTEKITKQLPPQIRIQQTIKEENDHKYMQSATKICRNCQKVYRPTPGMSYNGWKRSYLCPECWMTQVVAKSSLHIQKPQTPELPILQTIQVPQKIAYDIIKHITQTNGTIGIKDWYTLGIQYKKQWENFCTEVIAKSQEICNALGIPNKITLDANTQEIKYN